VLQWNQMISASLEPLQPPRSFGNTSCDFQTSPAGKLQLKTQIMHRKAVLRMNIKTKSDRFCCNT